jgi:VanZ family protein
MRVTGKSIVDVAEAPNVEPSAAGAVCAVQPPAQRSIRLVQQVASVYITTAVLATIVFLYASAIPLVFAVPDYSVRIRGAFEPAPWDANQLLDVVANVLAFVPVGFLWAAACNTALQKRQPKSSLFVAVALGCLGLAVLAEGLQVWIPLRDPSIRDVLALEWGAVLGYFLWIVAGRGTTSVLCMWIDRVYRLGGLRLFRLRWLALFLALLGLCLIVNYYASPAQLFLLYRFRSTSLQDVAFASHNASVKQTRGPLDVIVPSALVAILILGVCRIAQSVVRLASDRWIEQC